MSFGQLWLCDAACRTLTGETLPQLPLAIIREYVMLMELADLKGARSRRSRGANGPKGEDDSDVAIVPKGARKKKWTKHVVTKHRIKQAFRWR